MSNFNVKGQIQLNGVEIISSGTNYVKYADGTQVCWGNNTFSSSGTNTINLPSPFIDTDYGVCKINVTSASSGTYSPRLLGISGKTTTSFDVYGAIECSWVAVGKWK